MSGLELAAAAESLVGTPFRLHGRDPVGALDCIGLLVAALALTGREIRLPNGYNLRATSIANLLPDPASCGFAVVSGPLEPGDVAMLRSGPVQFHLVIAASRSGYVEAHAGLRRVVHSTAALSGPLLHHWRLIA